MIYRFIPKEGGISQNRKDIQTKHILPVELNAYLCRNARIMSEMYELLGNTDKSDSFKQWGNSFQDAIQNVLWNNEKGAWFDYDTLHQRQRSDSKNFYPSNLAPLWAECYP